MKELSLDEYRLMMGTQLWLKESFFTFIETLLGGGDSKPLTQATVNKLDAELQKATGELSKATRSKNSPNLNEELNKLNEKLQDINSKDSTTDKNMQTDKQKSEATQGGKVDLSNWSVLVHDNSQRRDAKVNSISDKLRDYSNRGYVK